MCNVCKHLVFRLVWAAQAVRFQAIATQHERAAELGDGPAFALTYGVPAIPAALLCQMGFSSRVGGLWVTRQLTASLKDNEGLREWLMENDALLERPSFGDPTIIYLLWRHAVAPSGAEHPRPWNRKTYEVPVKWSGPVSEREAFARIIPASGGAATVCGIDLSPLGTIQLPFNPQGAALDGSVASSGQLAVNSFGSA